MAATRQAFGLGEPATTREWWPPGDPGRPAVLHGASASYKWPTVEVVIAPSSTPGTRRADTGDQLRYWAQAAGLGAGDNVLLLTTQIYVPYQHMAALRVLGLARGCGVYSCGVAAASSLLPARAFAGRDYLQEIRAAIRAAQQLLQAAHAGGADMTGREEG